MNEQDIITLQKVASRLTPEKQRQWMLENSALIDSKMEALRKKADEDDPVFPNLIEIGL